MLIYIKILRNWFAKYPFTKKIIKFCIVGTSSTLVSLGVFWLLAMQFPAYNLLTKAIGYLMGFFVGFTLNKFWTYVDQTDDGEKYLLKYILVYGSTFIVYLLFNFVCDHYFYPNLYLSNLAETFGFSYLGFWLTLNGPFVSNVLSIIVNVFLNFIGTNFLVFRIPEPDKLFD